MPLLVHIETATKNCSVALSQQGTLIDCVELSKADYSHSEHLHDFIDQLLKRNNRAPEVLEGVVVDRGPGSYTGLRIGVATAKGLCYALNIPLVSIDSLSILAAAYTPKDEAYILPVLDARRMEVYTTVFDATKKALQPVAAKIVTDASFQEELAVYPKIVVVGNAQEKVKTIFPEGSKFQYISDIVEPSAQAMVALGTAAFEAKKFEDIAYFEPFYLKEFMTTPPAKSTP
ncbi:MAG: tRNA (adenosine(37)-N6)-threonylcarbamoyltransferase complex dimerization subunit type 1 TsaB [Flavobacteriaceae bacterium]|jgi:tRNA threonylcarbamoyladenosine biosynthesis protein TsaB